MVMTEVQVTAESSDSRTITPPPTPVPSVTPVLQAAQPNPLLHPWLSQSEDINRSRRSSPLITSANPFTTISSASSVKQRKNANRKRVAFSSARRPWRRFVAKLHNLDPIKLAYLRTSFVFAISILITWTPSSINRVYSFVHPMRASYSLNLASAVVLPLQGVWNAVIFCATSWNVLNEEVCDFKTRHWPDRGSERLPGGDQRRRGSAFIHTAPDGHEFGTSPRMGTVRVIRGGSL